MFNIQYKMNEYTNKDKNKRLLPNNFHIESTKKLTQYFNPYNKNNEFDTKEEKYTNINSSNHNIKNLNNKISKNKTNFNLIIKKKLLYLDKTQHLEKIINKQTKLFLFTRPNGFGKSLNLSTIDYFFNIEKNTTQLFQGLHISNNKLICSTHQNKYPVIKLDFSITINSDFNIFIVRMAKYMSEVYNQYPFLAESQQLTQNEKKYYNKILSYNNVKSCSDFSNLDLERSLEKLILMLSNHYEKKVVILIDDYDFLFRETLNNNNYQTQLL